MLPKCGKEESGHLSDNHGGKMTEVLSKTSEFLHHLQDQVSWEPPQPPPWQLMFTENLIIYIKYKYQILNIYYYMKYKCQILYIYYIYKIYIYTRFKYFIFIWSSLQQPWGRYFYYPHGNWKKGTELAQGCKAIKLYTQDLNLEPIPVKTLQYTISQKTS